jgi:hypothetical protein
LVHGSPFNRSQHGGRLRQVWRSIQARMLFQANAILSSIALADCDTRAHGAQITVALASGGKQRRRDSLALINLPTTAFAA